MALHCYKPRHDDDEVGRYVRSMMLIDGRDGCRCQVLERVILRGGGHPRACGWEAMDFEKCSLHDEMVKVPDKDREREVP